MKNTNIEWADSTWNPWKGCAPVSPGCTNCYASKLSVRFGDGKYRKGMPRTRHSDKTFYAPLSWNKKPWVCEACGNYFSTRRQHFHTGEFGEGGCDGQYHRRRVFSLSLGDWLDEEVQIEIFADMLDVIRRCPNLDFLLLTKRPENFFQRVGEIGSVRDLNWKPSTRFPKISQWANFWVNGRKIPENIWLGVSVENQKAADERIPELLKIPAKVRFLSCEPLLGTVDITDYVWERDNRDGYSERDALDWVICGGESGHNARPMHPRWARSLRDQCQEAGAPFFFKQWGEWLPTWPDEKKPEADVKCYLQWNGGVCAWKVGKKAAGRLLDGKEWNEFPSVACGEPVESEKVKVAS